LLGWFRRLQRQEGERKNRAVFGATFCVGKRIEVVADNWLGLVRNRCSKHPDTDILRVQIVN